MQVKFVRTEAHAGVLDKRKKEELGKGEVLDLTQTADPKSVTISYHNFGPHHTTPPGISDHTTSHQPR